MLACQRIGVPEPLINYIIGVYQHSQTRLQSGGEMSELIHCRQGVKQGDSLSLILFIFLIDWIVDKADSLIGFRLVGVIPSLLLFCNDMIVLASSCEDLESRFS